MGLVECSDCGHEVSDAAEACPNCGRPMQHTARKPEPQEVRESGRTGERIGTVLVLGSIGGCTAGMMATSPDPSYTWLGFGSVGVVVGFIVFIVGRLS